MIGQLGVPSCRNVVRLIGLWSHGNPIQPRPVARARGPSGRTSRTGNGEAAVGQPAKHSARHLDLAVVVRLGQ
eukprot:5030548-Alexandrium_andersonii.AAC.1